MTINEYMILLNEELKYLPNKKRKFYYNLYLNKMNASLDDGFDEDKITESLPNPFNLAMDIYKQENIDYATRRKRKTQSDAILSMLLGIFILLMTLSGFFLISYYFISSSINLFRLMSLVLKKEKLIIGILSISLVFIYLIIYIYLIDLLILLINLSIEKIALPFGKTIHLKDFSLIYLINKIFKKEHFTRIILIIVSLIFVASLITSFVARTYVYRSVMKVEPNTYNETYLFEEEFNTLKIDVDSANIYISKGDKLEVLVSSEFKRTIDFNLENGILKITTDKIKNFDLLELLKEPTPIINIMVPSNKKISFKMDNGIISLEKIDVEEISGEIFLGNVIIDEVNVNIIDLKETSAGISLYKVLTNELLAKMYQGNLKITESAIQKIDVNSSLGSIDLDKATIFDLTLAAGGNTSIKNSTVTNSKITIYSTELEISGGEVLNTLDIKSATKGNVSIGNFKAPLIKIITAAGDVVISNVEASLDIETGSNATISKLNGNLKLKALGNFLSVSEITSEKIEIETQSIEASIKFIHSDYFSYLGIRSKSTLYFIFAKHIMASDEYGNLHIDNDSSIITSDADRALYTLYYQTVLDKNISGNATERVYVGE